MADSHSLTQSDLETGITHILSIIDSTFSQQQQPSGIVSNHLLGDFQSQINEMLSSSVMGLLYGFVEGNMKSLLTREVREEFQREMPSEIKAKNAI